MSHFSGSRNDRPVHTAAMGFFVPAYDPAGDDGPGHLRGRWMTRPAPPARIDDVSDAQLVAAVRAREEGAEDRLIARFLPQINRMAYRLVGPGDFEDVVQETVCSALRSMRKLHHADGLPTWFGRIVTMAARKIRRRRRLLARLGFVEASPIEWQKMVSAAAPPDVVAELKVVYQAIERLPVRAQQALILRRVEGRPLDEIAALMDASLASVKRWIVSAEAMLDEAMEGEDR